MAGEQRTDSFLTVRSVVLVTMILVAAGSRLLPHPPNMSPVGALALFGGACFARRLTAFVVPLAVMLLSDVAIGVLRGDMKQGFHALLPIVYASLVLVVCLGFRLRGRRRVLPVAMTTLAGSLIFFLLTNFGVWMLGTYYPKTWEGLVACYTAAIPFFHNTLLGDAVWSFVLFGGLALLEHAWPVVRESDLAAVAG